MGKGEVERDHKIIAGLPNMWLFVVVWSLSRARPMDCNPPGSSVHGISQVRILEWVIISFSKEYSQPRGGTRVSCIGRWILYLWTTREARVAVYCGTNVCGTATGEADAAEPNLSEFMAVPVFFPISCSPVVLKVLKQLLIKSTLSMLFQFPILCLAQDC